MALVTLTPAMQQLALILFEIALMEAAKKTKGITEKQLVEEYIPKELRRMKRQKKQRDNA